MVDWGVRAGGNARGDNGFERGNKMDWGKMCWHDQGCHLDATWGCSMGT